MLDIDKESVKKVIKDRISISRNGCWEWKLKVRPNGYARVTYLRKSYYAHRLSYFAFVGNIKEGLDICHKCDNRRCCNPEHLFQGTRKDNMQDAVNKGRQAKGFKLPHSKLSESNKIEIMKRVLSGEIYKHIAADYGVTEHAIGALAIKNGVRRK